MRLFRRRPSRAVDPRPAIAEFWSWWQDQRNTIVDALGDDRADDAMRLLQPAVHAIDERLSWEVVPGENKGYRLVVTCAGVPELRSAAARWELAAPDDPDVEFASTRRRDPESLQSSLVKVDGYDFAMNELIVGARVDTTSGKVDVVIHHPLFTLVEHDHRLHVAYLGLDAAIGEVAVERWIGTVEVSVDPPIDAIPVASLNAVVEQIAGTGGGGWAAMEGRGPKGPIFAIVRRAANRWTHPLADTHVAVVLGFEDSGNGMPADPSISSEIEELEGHVVEAFGGEGPQVVHVGHVTGGGQVVAHFYVDGLEIEPETARPVLDKWSRGKASMARSYDPRWEHVAPFMGG